MRLTPSGNRRIMIAQAQDDNSYGIDPTFFKNTMNYDIEAPNKGNAPGPVSQSVESPSVDANAQSDSMMSNNSVESDNNDLEEKAEMSIKEYVSNQLSSFGVEPRYWQTVSNNSRVFSLEVDPLNDSLKGHFLVPMNTEQGEIKEPVVKKLCVDFAKKFNVACKYKFEGNYYKIDFSTNKTKTINKHDKNLPFQEFLGSEGQKKAASTLGEMIKDRKEELYHTLRKLDGKNASK